MIKAIILDLGNTIVPFDFARAYCQLEARSGLTRDEIRSRISSTGLVHRFEEGHITGRDFYQEVTALLGFSMPFDDFRELWFSIFLPDILIPRSFVASLRPRYRMLLLSNTNELHFELLAARYPILHDFDDWILSHRIGAMKPAPAIYSAAVAKAGCAPGECFFTDDIPAFVEAARACGLEAETFTGFDSLQAHLRRRGVEC